MTRNAGLSKWCSPRLVDLLLVSRSVKEIALAQPSGFNSTSLELTHVGGLNMLPFSSKAKVRGSNLWGSPNSPKPSFWRCCFCTALLLEHEN